MNTIKLMLVLLSATLLLCLNGCTAAKDPIGSEISEKTESSGQASSEEVREISKMLFDSSLSGIYNYCPSIIQADDNTRYIYYCTNIESEKVIDHIGFRTGTKNSSGGWDYGSETIVLKPSPGKWDLEHTCDPSVIAGEFKYNDENYSYLMAYLGCATTNNQDNQVGLAVAKNPEGPWIKTEQINPIAHFIRDDSIINSKKFQWGFGQPSLISSDMKGKVLLFYTAGLASSVGTTVERWDFSNLNKPVQEYSETLTSRGLTDLSGQQDFISNGDYCYDPVMKRYYGASDCHPFPNSEPDFISGAFRILYINEIALDSTDYLPGDLFKNQFKPGIIWKLIANIGEDETSFPRNHNVGIIRNPYGWMPSEDNIRIVYTMSAEGSGYLWSYRFYEYDQKIVNMQLN